MSAVCAAHPTEAALGNCTRCGAFVCRLDSRELDGQRYCETCAARPDVDWLEAFRLKHWGKRDGWAWLFGIFAPIELAAGIAMLLQPETRGVAFFVIASAVSGALWWLRVKQARWLTLAVFGGQAFFVAATVNGWLIASNIIPALILLSVIFATRTKLFFQIDVDREELKRMWNLYANNQMARYALSVGILGLLVWPAAPIALLCGIVGLARVDPDARPPIGRKGSAIAGIVLGVIGTGIGTAVVAAGMF